MITNYQQMETILNQVLETSGILNFLATQERERLLDLLYSSLTEFTNTYSEESFTNYVLWESEAKEYLTHQINESEDFFGIKDLSQKLEIQEILKKFYEAEFGA